MSIVTAPTETVVPPVAPSALRDIATGVAASPLWAEHAHHDPDGRRPVRLIATEHYEVWVIGWWPGQSVEPHDHGGCIGVLAVVEGELTELEQRGTEVEVRRLAAGTVRDLGADLVHDVLNATDAPATSIHVYSPPLRTMRFYDAVDGTSAEERPVEEERAVLDAGAAAGALHPSNVRRPETDHGVLR